jgi:tetratricopeptide (TPR) repeat protein
MKRLHLLGGVIFIALTASCSSDPTAAKRKALAEGDQFVAQKRYTEAIVLYRKALQYDPRYAEAHAKLARAYDRAGDPFNAAQEFIRTADLMPGDADAQVHAGVFLLAGGAFEDAKDRALKALAVKPSHVEAQLLLAQSLAKMKDLNGAIDQVEKTLKADASEPLVLSTLADLRVAQGNPKAAEDAFKRAVAADPKSVPASLGLGQFYMAAGRAADAEQWLKTALTIEPGNTVANRTLAALYLRTNRPADAEGPLKAAAQGTSVAQPKLILADYYVAMNRNGDARSILMSLLDDPVARSDSRLRLSVLEWRENRKAEAHKRVDEVIATGSHLGEAKLLKGRYLAAEGHLTQARDLLQASVAANPEAPDSHYWLGTTYRSLGDRDSARKEFTEVLRHAPGEVGSTLQLAQLDLQDGKLESAETRVNEVIRTAPRNGVARLTRVDILLAAGRVDAALKDATFLATNLPKIPEPQLRLGRIYLKQGNYEAAERAFQQAIQISNGRGDAVGGLIDVLIARGKLPDAQRTAEEWLAKNPKEVTYLLAAARAYKAAHDDDKTELALKRALAVDPDNVDACVELTNLYIREQKLDNARNQLEAIVAKQPPAVWAQTVIAQIMHVQNQTGEARQRYERILQIDPRAAIAANNLAMMLAEQGESLDRALGLAQSAVQQQPENANFNDTLGAVYLKKGLASLAVPPLELSVRNDPKNPELQYHLGQAYAQVGRKVDARKALENALALSDRFDEAAAARQLLSGLGEKR